MHSPQIRRRLLLLLLLLIGVARRESAQAQRTLALADYVTYVRQAQAAMRTNEDCAATAVAIAETLQSIIAIRLPDGSIMPVNHLGAGDVLLQSPCQRSQAIAYLDGLLPGAALLPPAPADSGSSPNQPGLPGIPGPTAGSNQEGAGDPTGTTGTGGNTAVAAGSDSGEESGSGSEAGSGGESGSSGESGGSETSSDSSVANGGEGNGAGEGETGAGANAGADGNSGDTAADDSATTDGSDSEAGADGTGNDGGTSGDSDAAAGGEQTAGDGGISAEESGGTGLESSDAAPDSAASGEADAADSETGGETASPDEAATADGAASPTSDPAATAAPEPPQPAAESEPNRLWLIAAAAALGLLLLGIALYLLLAPAKENAPVRQQKSLDEVASADEALDIASLLAADGQYREAVRHLFLAALLTLSENRVIPYEQSLTNRELLQAARSHPQLAQALQPVVATFDRVWYGYQPLTPADYETAVEQITRLDRFQRRGG